MVILGNNTIDVVWDGKPYALCCGSWDIKVNGIELDIPEEKKTSSMNTEKDYPQWRFGGDSGWGWEEIWETVHRGIPKEEWIEENKGWLTEAIQKTGLEFSEKELAKLISAIHDEIREQDWIHGMCGGCI